MAQLPLFTVATVTYNSEKWVRQAMESVLASSFTDFEYLVADDASADKTWDIIREYTDPRIRCWQNEHNLGEYPNRNKVLQAARGRYILYIDGDDILYKDALADYAKIVSAFPGAGAVWGVHPFFFDFVVLPYQFSPTELTALNFLSTYPLSLVGFTESLFGVEEVKRLDGFDERFATGDTYFKRRFSCFFPVVLVPAGKAFWRQRPDQATNRVRKHYRQVIEIFEMDKELLSSSFLPLDESGKKMAIKNFRIRMIKMVIRNTAQKGKIVDFFKLMYRLNVPYRDLFLLFTKGDYSYKAGASSELPLMNDYNFR